MATVVERQDAYLSLYTQREKELAGSGTPWLDQIRQEAIHRFAELGFPTTRLEDWKYTSVAPIAKVPFALAQPRGGLTQQELARVSGANLAFARLVFVNGFYAPELSSSAGLPPGVRLENLTARLRNGAGSVEGHLARHASFQNHAFVALNTAFLSEGALLEIPKGVLVEKPIQLLFVTVPGETPAVTNPRTLVVVGEGAQATLVETYAGLGDGAYFSNAVTEIVVGENAVLEHYRLQEENEEAFHVSTLNARLHRSSNFCSHNIALGGALVRNDVQSLMEGEGGSCALNGLFITRRQQHVDNHTLLDHVSPHCTSHELYKGILDDQSSGVFNGAIVVRPDAQKTDSVQHNKNLLLSSNALINTKPQLEIFADDVKCTHGATVGQLDKDAWFYLRARGIGAEQARSLLIYAFASEIIEQFKVKALRQALSPLLSDFLSIPALPAGDV
jgi:Fe-S cluster assembly protein SufD